MTTNPTAFPTIRRCDHCLGSGNEGHEDFECRGCKGTGGADCLVCHEPSPEQSTQGVCERCTTLEGVDEALDELKAVSGLKPPTITEAYEVVVLLRLLWAARSEWAHYRAAQTVAELHRRGAPESPEVPFTLPF